MQVGLHKQPWIKGTIVKVQGICLKVKVSKYLYLTNVSGYLMKVKGACFSCKVFSELSEKKNVSLNHFMLKKASQFYKN